MQTKIFFSLLPILKRLRTSYYAGLAWLVLTPGMSSASGRSVSVINSGGTDASDELKVFDTLIQTGQNFLYYAVAPAVGGWVIFNGFKQMSKTEHPDEKEHGIKKIIVGGMIAVIVPILQAVIAVVKKAGDVK